MKSFIITTGTIFHLPTKNSNLQFLMFCNNRVIMLVSHFKLNQHVYNHFIFARFSWAQTSLTVLSHNACFKITKKCFPLNFIEEQIIFSVIIFDIVGLINRQHIPTLYCIWYTLLIVNIFLLYIVFDKHYVFASKVS